MDFDLFRSIIRSLDEPEIIRLNYSGESLFHPHLAEAIRLAADTGAETELVTVFNGINEDRIRQLVRSGLDRLTVSLHAMTPKRYREIYGAGSLSGLKRHIETLLRIRESEKRLTPRLDAAFVAMKQNLPELSAVASYARDIGCRSLSIHPVICRDPMPNRFYHELANRQLTAPFKQAILEAVTAARQKHPDIQLTVSTPELRSATRLGQTAAYFPDSLPHGARIHSCDQNPWETIHILSSGDVVVCERLDRQPLGRLTGRCGSLAEIWHGRAYTDFRQKYIHGHPPACRTCPYKMAYIPGPLSAMVNSTTPGSPQLLQGWHPSHDGDGVVWSKKTGRLMVQRPPGDCWIRIRGILPHALDGRPNHLTITEKHTIVGHVTNDTNRFKSVEETFKLKPAVSVQPVALDLQTTHLFRPSDAGRCGDTRQLGFALISLEAR